MNILQINTTDLIGGAGMVGYRLHKQYIKRENCSHILVDTKASQDDGVLEIKSRVNIPLLNIILNKLKLRDIFLPKYNRIYDEEIFVKSDIVNIHNIHSGFYSLFNLPKLTKLKPTVWTFHDMWPFCGNSFHTYENDWWTIGEKKIKFPKFLDKVLFKLKKHIYSKSRFKIVVPSFWLAEKVKKSILKDFDLTVIPNGVDHELIKPLNNKQEIRNKLGINKNQIVISFISSGGLENKYKGGVELLQILEKVKQKYNILFLEIGTKNELIIKETNHWKVPYIYDRKVLNEYLNISDIFLFTSLAENFPLVLLEAQSAGLPVVTFDTGGCKEIVKHMETGYVSKFKDINDTIKGVEMLINDTELRGRFGVNARRNIEQNYTLEMQADRYLKLFEKTINEYKRYE